MGYQNIILKSLVILSSISTVTPFVIGLKKIKRFQRELKILFVLICSAILAEIAAYILTYVFDAGNIYLLNIYIILEISLIAAFYISIIQHKLIKIISGVFCFLFLVFAIVSLMLSQKPTFDYVVLTIESVIVMLFSVIGFHHLLKHLLYKNILDAPLFWFNTAFLIYFSGNLFLHLFSKYLQEHALYAFYELWGIWHSLLNIFFYILISIGFWKTRTLQTSNF